LSEWAISQMTNFYPNIAWYVNYGVLICYDINDEVRYNQIGTRPVIEVERTKIEPGVAPIIPE